MQLDLSLPLPPELEPQNCLDCGNKRTSFAWCKSCETKYFASQFQNWTTGNTRLDEIIQFTQLDANQSGDYIEWIPFDSLVEIEFEAKGRFSTVYSAIWLDGPRWDWDEESQELTRNGPLKVALKKIDGSNNITVEFCEQIYKYHRCIQSDTMADTFGMTQDPTTLELMFVTRWYENGCLHTYLDRIYGDVAWRDKVDMLWSVTAGLDSIHFLGLIHGVLHGGNLVVEDEGSSIDLRISDVGISGPFWLRDAGGNYGVLPYTAPEVLRGEAPTQRSDVYSFGIVMWTLSSGTRPFCDRAHDLELAKQICENGLRPDVVQDTPKVYQDLMERCWANDPEERPTARTLHETMNRWIEDICDTWDTNETADQFLVAEERRCAIIKPERVFGPKIHHCACYISQLLSFPDLSHHPYETK